MFRFEHTEYLLGLLALPLMAFLFYALIRWKKKAVAKIGDAELVRQLTGSYSPYRFLLKAVLALSALGLLIIGTANPQKQGAMEKVNRQGVDVLLLLDVSKSMLARDIKPSRLDRAKQLLLRLVDKLENDRLGLILFAGRPYLQMPLTTDHSAAKMYIQDAGPSVVPTQGTVIGEALQMANNSFNSKEHKYKSIVLLTDGEDHDPEALKMAKSLAESGVMINTVGIGSPDGSPIVDPETNELKKDEQGQTVISKLNEAELQQLAATSNGKYIRLDNVDDALNVLTTQLDSIEKKDLSDREFIEYNSFFQWLLGLALVLLLVEFFLSENRKGKTAGAKAGTVVAGGSGGAETSSGRSGQAAAEKTVQPVAAALVISIVLLICGHGASAQKENTLIRNGNRLYKEKKLDQSMKQYQEAVKQAPDNPTANYNLGNAQFRKNSYEDAAHSYDATIEHSTDNATKEKGYYNKGVSMIKQQKLQESIDAWKNALKLDPNDADARENLQKALMEQKKQQSQQNKDKKDQKKDQKDKDQKEKDQKDKDKDKDKKNDQNQPPKPQQSRLNKQQVEQLLKALQQKENEVQEKMNQNKVKSTSQPDKDW